MMTENLTSVSPLVFLRALVVSIALLLSAPLSVALFMSLFIGCAGRPLASNVQMIQFSEVPAEAPVRNGFEARQCSWRFFGIWLSSTPTIGSAIASAVSSTGNAGHHERQQIHKIENVTTEESGFDFLILGRKCLEVKAVAAQ